MLLQKLIRQTPAHHQIFSFFQLILYSPQGNNLIRTELLDNPGYFIWMRILENSRMIASLVLISGVLQRFVPQKQMSALLKFTENQILFEGSDCMSAYPTVLTHAVIDKMFSQ